MGLKFKRKYNLDDIKLVSRDARIVDGDGNIIFEQKNVTAPEQWSDQAVSIFASKYFNGKLGSSEREDSVYDVFDRIVNTIATWGIGDGYFDSDKDSGNFYNDLMYILLNQMGCFASPYLFNVGIVDTPQAGSCFITSVDDTMESITDLFKLEGKIFSGGSGSGTNISNLRGRHEGLSRGGYSSGPVSFMKAWDSFAGVIKSGGITRRAAVSRILDVDHPDIMEFIGCKVKEERKGKDLLSLGYSDGIDGDAAFSLSFQNANISVLLNKDFMNAVINDLEWELINITDYECQCSIPARDILMEIAKSSWECGDPGVLFGDNINKYNMYTERITGGNPCFEILLPPDNSCNLASINVLGLLNDSIDEDFYKNLNHIVKLFITAQDIVIDHSAYPNEKIKENSTKYRPLGLGIANAGGLLMSCGIPYDSDLGIRIIGSIVSYMTFSAYEQSSNMAKCLGSSNVPRLNAVIEKHYYNYIDHSLDFIVSDSDILSPIKIKNMIENINSIGVRNSQVVVMPPTGTISFAMDCDSTGIEPIFSLVKVKQLVGGGILKTVSTSVERGLEYLGYTQSERVDILEYVEENGEVVGAPHLSPEDYKVFQTALSSYPEQCVSVDGHLNLLEVLFGVISGGISKTINVPNDATVQEIYDLYIDAWKKGLKSIIIYRDGSKTVQPMSTVSKNKECEEVVQSEDSKVLEDYEDIIEELTMQLREQDNPKRKHLPDERPAINHKFNIGGHEGYITVGLFENGSPGEIFVTMSKAGSAIAGLVNSFSIAISLCLQYGVPLEAMVEKFSHMGFEPSGFTTNQNINTAKSIVDYIFRWMEIKFLKEEKDDEEIIIDIKDVEFISDVKIIKPVQNSGEICVSCGGQMIQNGACKACLNCGLAGGCG